MKEKMEEKMEERHIEKNLTNCKPREFFAQTNKIRKSAEKWLKDTDILNIRKNKPNLPENATDEQKEAAMAAQVKKNLSDMLEAIFDKYPNETLELLALLCFIDPKDIDEYPVEEYLTAFSDMIGNKAVLNFFTSLGRWGQRNI